MLGRSYEAAFLMNKHECTTEWELAENVLESAFLSRNVLQLHRPYWRRSLKKSMGIRDYLIEGVSGTGKTSVCNELQRRGYHAIHGDRELAYQGDPETGTRTDGVTHEYHIWHVDKVKDLVANQDEAVTFFCGGSRNISKFLDLFDGVLSSRSILTH